LGSKQGKDMIEGKGVRPQPLAVLNTRIQGRPTRPPRVKQPNWRLEIPKREYRKGTIRGSLSAVIIAKKGAVRQPFMVKGEANRQQCTTLVPSSVPRVINTQG
jgi:hypothetical protein